MSMRSKTTSTTGATQRDLLRALSVLDSVEDGTVGLFIGIDVNAPISRAAGQGEIEAVWRALRHVAEANLRGEHPLLGLARAQRSLLEALAVVDATGATGMTRLIVGLQEADKTVRDECPELADVFGALCGLADSVQTDRKVRA